MNLIWIKKNLLNKKCSSDKYQIESGFDITGLGLYFLYFTGAAKSAIFQLPCKNFQSCQMSSKKIRRIRSLSVDVVERLTKNNLVTCKVFILAYIYNQKKITLHIHTDISLTKFIFGCCRIFCQDLTWNC